MRRTGVALPDPRTNLVSGAKRMATEVAESEGFEPSIEL